MQKLLTEKVKAEIKQALQDEFKVEVWEYGKNTLILKKQGWLIVDDIAGHIETSLIKSKFSHTYNFILENAEVIYKPVIKQEDIYNVVLMSLLADDITLQIAEERIKKGHKLAVYILDNGQKASLVDETTQSCISGSWVAGLKSWQRIFEVTEEMFNSVKL